MSLPKIKKGDFHLFHSGFYHNTQVRRFFWGTVFFLAIMLILSLNFISEKVDLKEGQVVPKDIYAPFTITIEDTAQTEAKRQEAAAKVQKVYHLDESVARVIDYKLKQQYALVQEIKDKDITDQDKVAELRKLLPLELADSVWMTVLKVDQDTLKGLSDKTSKVIQNEMKNGVSQERIEEVRESILQELESLDINKDLRVFAKQIVSRVELEPNLIFNAVETERKKKQQMEEVQPVMVTILQNQKILGQGDVVTAEDLELLRKLGLQRAKSPVVSGFGLALLVLAMGLLIMLYLYNYKRDIYEKENHLILIGLIITLTLLVVKTVTAISIGDRAEIASLVGYMVPLAAGSMLVAILLDTKLAVFLTMVLGVFVGILTNNQLNFTIIALIGGIVGVYSVSKLSQRSDLAKAGIYVALANIVGIIALGLMTNSSATVVLVGCAFGAINGILSSVLTIGSLPYLESAFGITTSVRLLEISNPNHPLLKRLLLEAPGTYHHSILVGNLGEAAADAVMADSVMVRVAAYYHDIGKLKRPYFFIENQLTVENPHDKIAPTLSTLIITSHVKDGVDLAKAHKLPQVIIDIIAQHHGNSLVSFFYHKALEQDRLDTVLEADFRYQAAKPQTKEAAIVMLADSVEAAVRSLQKSTPGRIDGMVRKIIKDRLNDGQLDESDLTLKDLDLIADAFARVLNGIFHSRIEYPENMLKEMERRKAKDAAYNQQPAGQNSSDKGAGTNPSQLS